jgi:2-succinyl-5-enolpyruvyl-6-hydroxy-3-cyclohexene-1-carboxylate synthase
MAELYGLGYERADDVVAFRAALERRFEDGVGAGAGIVEVHTERAGNVALHARCWQAVSQALSC